MFVGSCNGYVRAIDRRTGLARWTYDTREDGDPVEFHGDPLVTEDLLIIGSDLRRPGGPGRVYAFDLTTGEPRWKHAAGEGVATDLRLAEGRVFGVTLADELIALDAVSGSLLWRFATGEPNPTFFANSSPAVSGGRVFFGGLDGSVYALDAESGVPVWKRALGPRVSTSILLAEGSLYAGTADGRLHRLDPATGAPVASFGTDESPGGRLTAAGGCLLSFLGERTISCVELSLEGFRWTRRTAKDWSSSRPYVWRRYALAADSGSLVAMRLTDGEQVWSVSLPGTVRGIGISEDALYAGTVQGAVHAYPLPALR